MTRRGNRGDTLFWQALQLYAPSPEWAREGADLDPVSPGDDLDSSPQALSIDGELRFAARWCGGSGVASEVAGGSSNEVGSGALRPSPLQPTWADHPAAEQARLAAAYRVWVLETARRCLVGGVGKGARSSAADVGEAQVRAVVALAVEQREALAELRKMWTWGTAAVEGMRQTALGGGGVDERE